MTCLPQLLRALARFSLPAVGLAALALADPVHAFTPALKSGGEATPLNTGSSSGASHQSSGPSIVRTIVGLLVVIAVIWGLTWILRQVKGRQTRAAGSGLTSLASLPLGSGRAVHIVRAGSEYLILGSAEHGVVPIHRYTEEQAREAGLLDLLDDRDLDDDAGAGGGRYSRADARGGFAPTTAGALLDRLREWTVRR
ncbi:MAG TPA: flagellar biosynthetic protein FliO [Solirubrobacteraceae bacterium]